MLQQSYLFSGRHSDCWAIIASNFVISWSLSVKDAKIMVLANFLVFFNNLSSYLYFRSNQFTDSIIFVFKNKKIYNYYQSYHMAITGRVDFVNVNQEHRITNLQIVIDKNSSSARVGGIMSNVIGFELYNSKAAIGMFPSVSASSRPFTISEDIRDKHSYVLPTYKNLIVNTKSYQNVYKLQLQFNKNIGATYLYVNRDFGFLRIDFEDGEVWERVL